MKNNSKPSGSTSSLSLCRSSDSFSSIHSNGQKMNSSFSSILSDGQKTNSSFPSILSNGQKTNSSFSSINNDGKKMKRNISFSTLEIRTYGVTLGDNPGGSGGPPLSLDWNYNESKALDIEEYEARRQPRRSRKDMHIDMNTRYFALATKFTSSEIKAATNAARQIRVKRRRSNAKIGAQPSNGAKATELFRKFMRKKKTG